MLFFFLALLITASGSLTGMGGGVILKPVLDLSGQFDVAAINIMSSVTVFTMTVVSIGRQLYQKVNIDFQLALPLAIGSLAGGSFGQWLFSLLADNTKQYRVGLVQNIILAGIIVIVFVYMLNKDKIPALRLSGIPCALLIGLLLGMISSFLGIGGGPLNVALLIFVFALDTKSAAICSLITIFFSQASKLVSLAAIGGFKGYDPSALLPLMIGAVAGGLIGSVLSKRLSDKTIELAFNGIQCIVLGICIINIFNYK